MLRDLVVSNRGVTRVRLAGTYVVMVEAYLLDEIHAIAHDTQSTDNICSFSSEHVIEAFTGHISSMTLELQVLPSGAG